MSLVHRHQDVIAFPSVESVTAIETLEVIVISPPLTSSNPAAEQPVVAVTAVRTSFPVFNQDIVAIATSQEVIAIELRMGHRSRHCIGAVAAADVVVVIGAEKIPALK